MIYPSFWFDVNVFLPTILLYILKHILSNNWSTSWIWLSSNRAPQLYQLYAYEELKKTKKTTHLLIINHLATSLFRKIRKYWILKVLLVIYFFRPIDLGLSSIFVRPNDTGILPNMIKFYHSHLNSRTEKFLSLNKWNEGVFTLQPFFNDLLFYLINNKVVDEKETCFKRLRIWDDLFTVGAWGPIPLSHFHQPSILYYNYTTSIAFILLFTLVHISNFTFHVF